MKRKLKLIPDSALFAILLTSSILLLGSFFSSLFAESREVEVPAFSEEGDLPTVILDAGHGGLDSGAVSVYGDEEKHLNLEVAKKLGAFLENGGVRVIYTRTEDEMLELLATDGMLVKRPILVGDDFVLVGFKEEEWKEII